jgi:hypothetical protein
MAQATALKTYNVTTNREDLTDVLKVITRNETPFFSSLAKTKATGTYHEWSTYSLSTGSDNAQIEGADYTLALNTAPSRTGAHTQIFFKQAKVSKTQQAVDTAAVDNMLASQIEWRMKEIATDVEKALFTGTGNSGASGTARRIKGALAWVTTNVETGTGTGSEALSEDMFNDTLQSIWDQGGKPDTAYVNSFQKRQISSFSTSNTRYQEPMDGRLKNYVSVYESDFGVIEVKLDSFITTSVALIVQSDLWAVAQLRPFMVEDYPSVGSYVAKTIEGELALEARQEAGNGQITGLSTS